MTKEMYCRFLIIAFLVFDNSMSNAQYLYTIAGGGKPHENITAPNASIRPDEIVIDSQGNIFFVDEEQHSVRRIDATTSKVTTIAGAGGRGFGGDNGLAIASKLNSPRGLAFDYDEKNLFIADYDNRRVRKINMITGMISTVAGNGQSGNSGDGAAATSATLTPIALHVDGANNLYIADAISSVVRKVNLSTGVITRFAGKAVQGNSGDGGAATDAALYIPSAVASDGQGRIYIADSGNDNIRRVNPDGVISTFAGTTSGFAGDGGPATSAKFDLPDGLAIDGDGNVFVVDSWNLRVRKIAADGTITTIAGKGLSGVYTDGETATNVKLTPSGLALDPEGRIVIADPYNIRRVGQNGVITTIAGNNSPSFEGDNSAATLARLYQPSAMVKASDGSVYIADNLNNRIRKINGTTSTITTVVGNGNYDISPDGTLATSASLKMADAIAVDANNNIYFTERFSYRIRRVDATTKLITTIAGTGVLGFSGDGGLATAAKISIPMGLCIDPAGNVYFTDDDRIRKIDATTKIISTVAGSDLTGFSGDNGPAVNAVLYNPRRITSDVNGNIFFSDESNNRVRRIDKVTGIITTVAGNGSNGFSGDGGSATSAQLNFPCGVSVDASGNIFIADRGNNRIRKVDGVSKVISTVAGDGGHTEPVDGTLATIASLDNPLDVFVDSQNRIYIADSFNDKIKIVRPYGALFSFANTATEYDGNPKQVNVTPWPVTLPFSVTYNGEPTAPSAVGTYEVKAVSTDAQVQGIGWATLVIAKGRQSITFHDPGDKFVGDGSFVLDANSSSTLPVVYTIDNPAIASVNGNIVTMHAAGQVTITASHEGSDSFLAAQPVSRIVNIGSESIPISATGELVFGEVEVNDEKELTVALANNGTSSISISNFLMPEGFSIDISNAVIPSGTSKSFKITFSPEEDRDYSGEVRIISNATSGDTKLTISGRGLILTSAEENQTEWNVYPNPTNGIIYLQGKIPPTDFGYLIDHAGRKVGSPLIQFERDHPWIDLTQYKDGIYFLAIPNSKRVVRITKH